MNKLFILLALLLLGASEPVPIFYKGTVIVHPENKFLCLKTSSKIYVLGFTNNDDLHFARDAKFIGREIRVIGRPHMFVDETDHPGIPTLIAEIIK